MKKVYLALSLLVVAAGVASHFRDVGRQWLATLMEPRENEPVPLMRVDPQKLSGPGPSRRRTHGTADHTGSCPHGEDRIAEGGLAGR